ncbi:MAG: hypothetical protein IIZ47_03610 [Erysipelotrichaceae bacterium]|nr:hypothetical protein [Erysipelotrichaceae bacterium]
MSTVFDVVLLLALPASGKSEVRKLLSTVPPEKLHEDFHIGDNLQLDDFPYVFLMRRIDEELEALGKDPVYYPGQNPFIDGRDWGTLIELLNEDYYDMVAKKEICVDSYAEYLFKRIDDASERNGLKRRIEALGEETVAVLKEKLEDHCKAMTMEKLAGYPDTLENKTIVIEMARGGSDGASMPLQDPFGYQYSLRKFCPEILEKAAVLYVYVEPEESRRKNEARYDPNDPGSSIHHMTPVSVMMYDYGCDDMLYLKETSEIEDTITIRNDSGTYYLPIGVFDNRVDKTTFLRDDPATWDQDLVREVTASIHDATDTMWKNYHKN